VPHRVARHYRIPIIEYLEELHPDPPMIGTEAQECARVRELERFVDLSVLIGLHRSSFIPVQYSRIVNKRCKPPSRRARPRQVHLALWIRELEIRFSWPGHCQR
jgi:glutathione S-transferase